MLRPDPGRTSKEKSDPNGLLTVVFLMLFFIFLPSIVFADEYVLVMSKEDNVCQHMLKLYNEDLKKYGVIKYDKHMEFNAIKWEEKKYYRMHEGKKEYPMPPYDLKTTVKISNYDINNDGRNEIVIMDTGYFRRILSDYLYYFKYEDADLFKKDEFDMSILGTKPTGRIVSGAGSNYELKELPKFIYPDTGDKESKAYYSLGRYLYIHPFYFDGTYYLEINDEIHFDTKGIYTSKFLIILKYTNENQLNDVCYFLKTSNCEKSRKGDK